MYAYKKDFQYDQSLSDGYNWLSLNIQSTLNSAYTLTNISISIKNRLVQSFYLADYNSHEELLQAVYEYSQKNPFGSNTVIALNYASKDENNKIDYDKINVNVQISKEFGGINPSTYTIQSMLLTALENNNANPTINPHSVGSAKNLVELTAYDVDGFKFVGWYTNDDILYSSSLVTTVKISDIANLRAVYKPNVVRTLVDFTSATQITYYPITAKVSGTDFTAYSSNFLINLKNNRPTFSDYQDNLSRDYIVKDGKTFGSLTYVTDPTLADASDIEKINTKAKYLGFGQMIISIPEVLTSAMVTVDTG